jgi:prepilin-type N-terminal cleavage/methylation domain-containing protein
MKTFKFNKIKINNGFTLVETLIAVSVLLISIAGPLSIASKGLIASRYSRDQIVASSLAQEAVELIRNRRDNNTILGNMWITGLSSCFGSNGCKVDASDGNFSSCNSGGCPVLNKHKTTGFYSYSSGTNYDASIFTRTIHLEQLNPDEIKISVDIAWGTGALRKNFTIDENLFDWE